MAQNKNRAVFGGIVGRQAEEQTDQQGQGEYLPAGNESGRIITQGVGLREAEVFEIKRLADALGVSANALMRLAVRYFLIATRNGWIDPAEYIERPEPKAKIRY